MNPTETQLPMRSPCTIFSPRLDRHRGRLGDPTKRGYKAMVGLIRDGYKGAIYPINPKVDMILGVSTCASLADVPGPIDLA